MKHPLDKMLLNEMFRSKRMPDSLLSTFFRLRARFVKRPAQINTFQLRRVVRRVIWELQSFIHFAARVSLNPFLKPIFVKVK